MKPNFFILISIFSFLFASINHHAQEIGFNYKTIVYSNGIPFSNQSVNIRFSFFDDTDLVYQESHVTTTNNTGIAILNMGEGTIINGTFNAIDFSHPISYKVEVDTGSGYVDMGTFDFKMVPIAKYAQQAGELAIPLKINDLSDAKSDDDGSDDGSSLFIGLNAGDNDDGSNNFNIGIGKNALTVNTTGAANLGVGFESLGTNSTGNYNIAIGHQAVKNNTTGIGNVGIGLQSLTLNNANYNSALGYQSLYMHASGAYNTSVGSQTLYSNNTGTNNTVIGSLAGYGATGSNNVFLGYRSGYYETGDNKLYIDNTSTATPLIHGDFSTNEITINGGLSIKDGTQSLGKVFMSDANGNGQWSNYSRTNIKNFSPLDIASMNSFGNKSYDGFWGDVGNFSQGAFKLDLPIGAVVTSVTIYYKDNSSAGLDFYIRKKSINYTTDDTYTYITIPNINLSTNQTYTQNINLTISDDFYYFVEVSCNGAWPTEGDLVYRGLKVTYTY